MGSNFLEGKTTNFPTNLNTVHAVLSKTFLNFCRFDLYIFCPWQVGKNQKGTGYCELARTTNGWFGCLRIQNTYWMATNCSTTMWKISWKFIIHSRPQREMVDVELPSWGNFLSWETLEVSGDYSLPNKPVGEKITWTLSIIIFIYFYFLGGWGGEVIWRII